MNLREVDINEYKTWIQKELAQTDWGISRINEDDGWNFKDLSFHFENIQTDEKVVLNYEVYGSFYVGNNREINLLSNTISKMFNHYNDKHDYEKINNPSHYQLDSGKEVIEIIKDTLGEKGYKDYCIGNIIKYITRYENKNGIEDLKKAIRYINFLIEEEKDNEE